MLAVVFSKPDEYKLAEVERPAVGLQQVLVQVKSTTICGTDVKMLHGQVPHVRFPHIPGHEFGGEVVAVGEGVTNTAIGERVGVEVHVGCETCSRCREGLYNLCLNYGNGETGHAHIGFTVPGGLAEYCAVPASAVHKLPTGLDFDQGAFTDTLGIVLWAIERAGGISAGECVAVVGPGALGLLAVQAARALGAGQIIAIGTAQDQLRLKLAEQFGANAIVVMDQADEPHQAVHDLNGGEGPDLVLEFAGTAKAGAFSLEIARRGGRVVLAGATSPGKALEVDLAVIVRGHISVYGSVANPQNISQRANKLMNHGVIDVNPLITHHMPLDEFDRAWSIFSSRSEEAIRIMLHPGGV